MAPVTVPGSHLYSRAVSAEGSHVSAQGSNPRLHVVSAQGSHIGSPQASHLHSHAVSAQGSLSHMAPVQGSSSAYVNGPAMLSHERVNVQMSLPPVARQSSSPLGRPVVSVEQVASERSSSSTVYSSSSGRAKLPPATTSELRGTDVAALSHKSIAAAKAALSLSIDHSRRASTDDLVNLSAMAYDEDHLMGSERHVANQPSKLVFMDHVAFDDDASDSAHWHE
jgi:hypothetical protein